MSEATFSANPWTALPQKPPFALPDDLDRLSLFAARSRPEHRFDFGVLPEPFIGRPDAPVVLLGLNPGFDPRDEEVHARPEFAGALRANLAHEASEYPFYLLDPRLPSPGQEWWTRRLKPLIQGTDRKRVAQNVLCIEYFPYHSVNFHRSTPRVASQAYSIALVDAAIARKAHIVLMRAAWAWLPAVPNLGSYQRLHLLSNPQSPYVSPGNCPNGFGALLQTIADVPPCS